MDVLDDDEDDLDPTSTEALTTATKEGDKQLDPKDKGKSKDEKEGDNQKQKGEPKEEKHGDGSKKPEKGKEASLEHRGDKKPKQGDERKHESVVARSG